MIKIYPTFFKYITIVFLLFIINNAEAQNDIISQHFQYFNGETNAFEGNSINFSTSKKYQLNTEHLTTSLMLSSSIVVTSASNSIINGSTSTTLINNTDFGLYDVNSGSKYRTYTITNGGTSNLTFGAIPVSFVAGSSTTFFIYNQPSANTILVPNASATFTIAFDPTAIITTSATVSIASNDVANNPFTFLIEGEGAEIYPDTDGDGISNNLDLDDDNDGISDTYEQSNCLASTGATVVETVFLNETFGSGINRVRINGTTPGVTTNYCFEDGTPAQASDECDTNINLGDGKYTVHYSVTDGDGVPNEISNTGPDTASWADSRWYKGLDHTINDTYGRMAIFNAAYTPGIFYETIVNGVLPNVIINYSFSAINIDNADVRFDPSELPRVLPNITVKFLTTDFLTVLGTFNTGDLTRCSASGNSCELSEWKDFFTTLTFNQSEFIIQFSNNAPGGAGNDLAIDDIKITQTFCDLDGDGVADILDLDNDNDGIPNIVEAKMVSNPDLDYDATTAGLGWSDVNNNGWSDNFESAVPIDSDGDGVKDYADLDSDNDSIFDTVENDNKGDVDVNGDGHGDGNDLKNNIDDDEFDGDGILGIVDTNDTDADALDHGNAGYNNPLDSDLDSIPNYLDIYNNTTLEFDIANSINASFDANNNGVIDGTVDAEKDGILDSFDNDDATIGSPRDYDGKYSLYFDGRNDYIEDSGNIVLGLSQATLMAWVKLDTNFSNDGVVLGQDNFFIKINSQQKAVVEVNGIALTLTGPLNTLPKNKWVHVAAVFDGPNNSQTIKLYVNGELKDSRSSSPNIQTSTNTLFRIGRSSLVSGADYFNGEIDEVRVFNAALTDDQVQKIVYQEFKDSDFTKGDIIPLNIPSFSSNSLIKYYKMDTFKDDIVDNKVSPTIDQLTGAKLYNIQNIYPQTAPLPYETIADGAWTNVNTWKHGNVWDITDVASNKPWYIVHLMHNVSTTSNHENLGLIIDSGKEFVLNGDVLLTNNWYLKLNGKIDLQGKSQLIQTMSSQLEPRSSGLIERDQKGVKNLYNYNYWSSPVSTINTINNNNGYTVANVLKDGVNPSNVQNINWISGYNGLNTSPLSIANHWIYKFQNITNLYSNWTQIGSTGLLLSGQGFTMKGSDINLLGATQNYIFVGKPNNGTIINPVAAGNINLSGNPYPSALDSQEFIKDNIDGAGANAGSSQSIKGTLYFWQHANENNSHYLANYKGGYATLNLTGGVPPMAVSYGTNGLGSSSRIPNRYIPVGQGFFVSGDASGGNITFKNSQRGFRLETDNTVNNGSNEIFKKSDKAITPIDVDTFKRIRLSFNSVDQYKRQILLGFMEDKATDGEDPGYDSKSIDNNNPSDAYFVNGTDKLIIQGVGYFKDTNIYPVGLKSNLSGNVTFKIETLENFDQNQQVFIFDADTNQYHNITNLPFEINIVSGNFDNRFSLRFQDPALSTTNEAMATEFNIFYNTTENVLNVINNSSTNEVKSITLFNILGQEILVSAVKNQKQIQFSLSNISTGTYIVKVKTANGDFTKKIIVE